MYMYRETYVKKWDHQSPEEQFDVTVKKGGEIYKDINSENISTVSENVAYWRKFNALHNWIVNNCADGRDECQKINIYDEALVELYDTLKQVNMDHSKAEELLPTTSGFFFGSTDYDDYYFQEVEQTIEVLKPYVKSINEGTSRADFYYQASW